MIKNIAIIAFLSITSLISWAQHDAQNYEGEWIGFLPDKSSFNFQVLLEKLDGQKYRLTIANNNTLINKEVPSIDENYVRFDLDQQLFFDLKYDDDQQGLTGYIKTGKFYYYVS